MHCIAIMLSICRWSASACFALRAPIPTELSTTLLRPNAPIASEMMATPPKGEKVLRVFFISYWIFLFLLHNNDTSLVYVLLSTVTVINAALPERQWGVSFILKVEKLEIKGAERLVLSVSKISAIIRSTLIIAEVDGAHNEVHRTSYGRSRAEAEQVLARDSGDGAEAGRQNYHAQEALRPRRAGA